MTDGQPVIPAQRILTNPAGWPADVLPLFERAITCEFATLNRQGYPITFPLTPYIGVDERTLDVATGLTYPAKAERARRNPKVGMLFSDPVGSGLVHPPTVLVYGLATVRDADLQGNTDRYVRLSLARLPEGFKGMPSFVMRRLQWYFVKIWIEVTPLRILWWPEGDLDLPAQHWDAPAQTEPRPSDPAPAGRQPPAWKESPKEWRETAAYAVKHLGIPVLTMVDAEGYPLPLRVKHVSLAKDGFHLLLPTAIPTEANGSACLTFHTHAEVFTGQQNRVFLGKVIPNSDGALFIVERPLADWSLGGSRLAALWSFIASGRRLHPRLHAEAARREQPVPKIHLPGDR